MVIVLAFSEKKKTRLYHLKLLAQTGISVDVNIVKYALPLKNARALTRDFE